MLCEADIKVSWRSRPRGFIALMSLYESNYLRFARLAGDLRAQCGTLVSRVAGDCELVLTVIEQTRYTSALNLTYLLPAAAGRSDALPERTPDMRLRAYHDARLLEAEELRPNQRTVPGSSGGAPGERELRQRWQRNMMLNKWLEYCAERGHRFSG
ncbi:MAG: DUF1249 domain-containing protein [Steroidobacterales bacterium]